MNRSDADKHEQAFDLYKSGYSQQSIAKIFDVADKTVTRWKVKGDWDRRLADAQNTLISIEENLLYLISYQLRGLAQQAREAEGAGSMTPISPKEVDALQKLFSSFRTIYKGENFSLYQKAFMALIELIRKSDLELAKALIPYTDNILNELRRKEASVK